MRSPAERRGAIAGLAALTLLAAIAASSWVLAGHPVDATPLSPNSYSPPSHLARYDGAAVGISPSQLRSVVNDDQRVRHALTVAVHHRAPFLASPATGRHDPVTLVLTPRARPYTLETVMARVPSAFVRPGPGTVLLKYPLLLTPGSALVVDSKTVTTLQLSSDPGSYAAITAVSARLDLRGHPGHPLLVTSWDPHLRGPDLLESDGRAYVQNRGGTLTVRAAALSYLGFGIGRSSGVAWLGSGTTKARGGAAWSTFSHNHFGGYSFAAEGLVVTHSAFLDNTVYGFDPHDGTSHSVISDSVAARNGRHGFIFSRGCHDNVLRHDEAYDNGVAGFVIDDGRVASDGNPRHAVAVPSDRNRLVDVLAHDNGTVGVIVEGGTGNSVEHSTIDNNRYGIWVKNATSSTLLLGNTVRRSRLTGIRLFAGTRSTDISDNLIAGGAIGITADSATGTRLKGVRVTDAVRTGLRIAGPHDGLVLTAVSLSGIGRRAVDVHRANLPGPLLTGVETRGWQVTRATPTPLQYVSKHANLVAWVPIVVLPPLFWLPSRRRRPRPVEVAP